MRETIEQLKAENALLKAQIEKGSTASLFKQLEMQQVITTISTRFVHVEADLFQTEIENALKKIGIQAGIDRSYLFLYNHEKNEMNNTHEWCAPGIKKEIDNLKNLPKSQFPWWNKKLEKNQVIHLFSLQDLPEEATEEIRQLFSSGRTLYYSDIAEELRLDLELVVDICHELQESGEIGIDDRVL